MNSNLPPVMREHEAPGYVWFSSIERWVRDEDAYMAFDVMDEIAQTEYAGRRHGTRHVKNQGCRGPLCRKALRDWKREYYDAAKPLGPLVRPIRRFDDLLDRMLDMYEYLDSLVWDAPEPEREVLLTGCLLAA